MTDWYQVGKMFKGKVKNHPQIPDGQECYTDLIVEIKYGGDWIIAVGGSRRQYLLFHDKHHPHKKDADL